jgi:hypothetical protein
MAGKALIVEVDALTGAKQAPQSSSRTLGPHQVLIASRLTDVQRAPTIQADKSRNRALTRQRLKQDRATLF